VEEWFTPQTYVDCHLAQREISIEDIGVAPIVVITWGRNTFQAMVDAVGAQPAPNWLYREHDPLYTGQVQGQPVSILWAPVGAPGTVMMMEVMIPCGARIFLGLGWAGSLQPYAPVGTLLIPTGCIREEGTSFHYLDDKATVSPDERLAKALQAAVQAEGLEVLSGPLWTTDAPFRELRRKIEAYGRRGALGVDMETSAMYALGQFRDVRVCNLLVVSDELWREWRPALGRPEVKEATAHARRVILRCLASGITG